MTRGAEHSTTADVHVVDASHRRLLTALFLQGLVYAATAAAIALFLGSRFGVGRAGIVLGLGGLLGRIVSPRLEAQPRLLSTRPRARLAAGTGALFIVVAAYAPWWSAIPAAACATAFATSVVTVVMHAIGDRLPSGSAASMTGQAAGLSVSGLAAGVSEPALVVVCVLLALVVVSVPAVAALPHRIAADPPRVAVTRAAWRFPFVLALVSYGPLAVFSVLVAAEFGPRWLGPAFFSYAAGSWVAASRSRWAPASEWGAALFAAAAGLIWITGLQNVPFMLVGRFVAGVLMFLAQGAVLTRASQHGGRERLSSALAGLGVGTQLAAAWAGVVAEVSVPVMAGVSVLSTLVLALLLRRAARPAE